MGTVTDTTADIRRARATRKGMHDQYAEQGFAGPIRILSSRGCQQFLREVDDGSKVPPLEWHKGHAASSRAFYAIGTHPAIMDVVALLLGEDVMLWGASIQTRASGAVHPWHSDIETSSAPLGKTVSVWMGIHNTGPDSSLLIIPYSHRFGVSLQEVRQQLGRRRREATNNEVLEWARERDMWSQLVKLEMTDGEALFFDGQLWHGSHNRSGKTRQALLLQYATPDTAIRIPDLNHLNWPFRQLDLPKPPCLIVRGSAKPGVNRIVSPPVASSAEPSSRLPSRTYPLQIPLVPDEGKGWRPYPIFAGSTADLRSLTCHASVLTQGHCPHPPHTHDEEELLLLFSGEVDLILPTEPTPKGDNRKRLKPGQFVYYPAHFAHTLETVSQEPANYLMFKWRSVGSASGSPLRFGQFNFLDDLDNSNVDVGFRPRLVFAGPTAHLRKLHCHTSTLASGAGYEPHIDAYDVAIILLKGEIETLGERVRPYSVVFYPAGEPHGVRNPGDAMAKYIVFEFHRGQKWVANADALPRPPSLLAKLRDPERWKRKLKCLVQRFIAGVLSREHYA